MQHGCSNLDLPAVTHASKGIMISFLWQPSRCVMYSKETNVVQCNMMAVGLQPHHSRGFIKYNSSPSCVMSLHYNLLFLSLIHWILCWHWVTCPQHVDVVYTKTLSFLFFFFVCFYWWTIRVCYSVFYKSCQKGPFGALMQGSRCDLLQFK